MRFTGYGLAGLLGILFLAGASRAAEPELEAWIDRQAQVSQELLLSAISPADGAPGAVMASPSRNEPDYYYHWIRDGALTMREVLELYRQNRSARLERILFDYAAFSRLNQLTPNPSGAADDAGVGEPKFEIGGGPFNEGWGRPQNDGPALRAHVLIDFARELWLQGRGAEVAQLYRAEMPARSVIKVDLEYVAREWRAPSFDLWEEVRGDHFYTRIAQWRALHEGADFARALGDGGAARYYEQSAQAVQASLDAFWSDAQGYIRATLHAQAPAGVGRLIQKESGLDSAVILGVLHSGVAGMPFGPDDERVIATVQTMERRFADIYGVNRRERDQAGYPLGVAIGRYPEDTYDGTRTDGRGNPWFLATHALAEYDLRLARIREAQGGREAAREAGALRSAADACLRRSRLHTGPGGHQSEQINRENGFMQGARDLTWSYASFLSLVRARR